jgi:diacylglycerol O-acyltransferase / wax synthase
MRRLSLLDAGWLMIEAPERPMHVGGLQLFSLPEDAGPTFVADLVANALEHTEIRPPFDQKLVRPHGLAGVYHWEPTELDLTYHVRHLALPQPGRIRELLSLVSRNHQALLDRHRPLWESFLIEGLADGRIALYTKTHHAMMDGVAAMKQVLKAFTPDPDRRDLAPPWALPADADGRTFPAMAAGGDGERGTSPWQSVTRALTGVADQVGGAVGAVTAMAQQVVASRLNDAEVIPYQAPRSMLNQRLTGSRRFVAQSYDFERIRAVSRAYGATVNDVVLTMCGGALRAYLASHDALPDAPLIAMVPVSIRPADGGDEGNAISMLLANLATDLADPVDRLERVKDSMDRGKARLSRMSQTELADYGILLMAPILAGELSRVSGWAPPLHNVVISNVPGPAEPLYWNGVRMDGLYPASLLTDGYALNITQTSYAGSMEFGITADRQALPRIQRLIDHLEDELVALEKAAP